jgi:hypothetical protein
MERIIITQTFEVDVPRADHHDGTPAAAEVITFSKGMVIEADRIPVGHTAQDWVDKELAKAAE